MNWEFVWNFERGVECRQWMDAGIMLFQMLHKNFQHLNSSIPSLYAWRITVTQQVLSYNVIYFLQHLLKFLKSKLNKFLFKKYFLHSSNVPTTTTIWIKWPSLTDPHSLALINLRDIVYLPAICLHINKQPDRCCTIWAEQLKRKSRPSEKIEPRTDFSNNESINDFKKHPVLYLAFACWMSSPTFA